jgi:hypothetical protein
VLVGSGARESPLPEGESFFAPDLLQKAACSIIRVEATLSD